MFQSVVCLYYTHVISHFEIDKNLISGVNNLVLPVLIEVVGNGRRIV